MKSGKIFVHSSVGESEMLSVRKLKYLSMVITFVLDVYYDSSWSVAQKVVFGRSSSAHNPQVI